MKIYNYEKIYEIIKKTVKQDFGSSHNSCPVQIKNIDFLPKMFYMPKLKQKSIYDACKTDCINVLKGWNPFEKVFILDAETGDVIKEINGGLHECFIDRKFIKKRPVKILHGHVASSDNVVPPVSFRDFKLLIDNDHVTEISAVNKFEQESYLRKNKEYKGISNRNFKKIKKTYIDYLMKYADEADRSKILELRQYCDTHKNSIAVEYQIAELLTELQYKKSGAEALDRFWKDYAKDFGLDYKPF